jgi:RNA polymerase sigma-70 factor (ECF subfamily)
MQPDAFSSRRSSESADDPQLMVRVADRDGAAFEALYRAYHPRLRRFLERVTRRPQLVEEILDDTMLVVWRKAATYDVRARVSTWIFGIAFRRALKALKRLDEAVEFDADRVADVRSASPESGVLARETRDLLALALDALSPEHRAVIELTYYQGYSCAEIAGVLQCPVNTVKTRMFHARRRLRMLLAHLESAST